MLLLASPVIVGIESLGQPGFRRDVDVVRKTGGGVADAFEYGGKRRNVLVQIISVIGKAMRSGIQSRQDR